MSENDHIGIKHVITVDDDPRTGWILSKILAHDGWTLTHFESPLEVLNSITRGNLPDLIMADLQMPEMNGIELTQRILAEFPTIPVIVMTAFGTIETAVKAIKAGAVDFVTKPIIAREIREIIKQVMKTRIKNALHGNVQTKGLDGGRDEMIGESPAFLQVIRMLNRVASKDITVLLRGESGTGKELFARTIHKLSNRNSGPFVTIDCATLPDTLMESELFGHEKGAFTDARHAKTGKFELADTGTILLDEIGNLTASSQMKILRVIQERTIERLGGNQPRHINVRLIAATNADLEESIHRSTFREDLFYRLNEITIRIPPLRSRQEDIPLLAAAFARSFAAEYEKGPMTIDPDVLGILGQYHWPGNVRELKNVMKRAVILADDVIREKDLPEELLRSIRRDTIPSHLLREDSEDPPDLKELARGEMQRIERDVILRTLEQNNWHLSKTAETLGVDRKTLRNKMRTLNVQKSES